MRCSIYECAHRPLKADFSVQFPVNRSIKFDYSALSICQSSTYHRMLRPLGLVKDVNQHGLLISWIFMADLPGLNLNRRNSIALSCTCEYRKQSLAKVTGRIRPFVRWWSSRYIQSIKILSWNTWPPSNSPLCLV